MTSNSSSHRGRLGVIGVIAAVLPLVAWHGASAGSADSADRAAAVADDPAAPDDDVADDAEAVLETIECPPDQTTTTSTTTTTTVVPSTTIDPSSSTSTTEPPTEDPCSTTTTTVPPTTTVPQTTVVAPTTTVPGTPPVATTTSPTTTTEVSPGTTVAPPAATTTTTTTASAPSTTTSAVDTTGESGVQTTVPAAPVVPPDTSTAPPETTAAPPPETTAAPPATTARPPETTTTKPTETTLPADPTSDPVEAPFEAPGGRVIVPAGAVDTGQLRSITFPVAGPVRYGNDWGACRDGCRRAHKGIDVIGVRLQPLLAMHDGTVHHLIDHPTAGFGVAIVDDEGWRYDIYHVNNDTPGTDDGADDGAWRFADGIVEGARVRAGQVIGWMGDSGNSEGSVPHAHVEIHLPGGTAINPYWSLRQAQRDVNCAVTEVDDGAVEDPEWLETDWAEAVLPGSWRPLELTGGGRTVEARLWIGDQGYIPVDGGALFVGDPRFDDDVDCTAPPAVDVGSGIPAELSAVLATIRTMETGGNYATTITAASASGAYAFIDAAWGNFGGYPRAYLAPPAVQDQKAVEFASQILDRNGGDVSVVPAVWYIGHVPVGAEWDTVPSVGANILTPREYQTRWLRVYGQLVGADVIPSSAPAPWAPTPTPVCRTAVVDIGTPDAPRYLLTRAADFAVDPDGQAIIAPATSTTTTTLPPGETTTTSTTTTTTTVPGASTTTTTTIPMITLGADGVTPVDPCDPTRPESPRPPVDDDVTVAVRPRPVRPIGTHVRV